ncbi:SWIM zinc finger family protein [Arabiibacter massiliensis]|uniref:SWIM zinc finger family protein n=1 Tax=Arabiibacter massiliensis TaxID=1870985 RepID=UPI0009BB47C8|nr:SWIM zinc finger family protein [Arabiibacter massiliensis]
MQLDPDWKSLFSSPSLIKGYAYHLDGCVRALTADGKGWTAVVEGSYDYRVFVPSAPGDLRKARCDCPHFAGGNFCKHLAATCFEIEALREAGEEAPAASPAVDELEQLMDKTAEDDVRAFLLEALRADDSLRQRFVGAFAEPDAKRSRRDLERAINQAIRLHARRRFIDYRDAFPFQLDFSEAVEAAIGPLLDHNAPVDAFDLVEFVLLRLQTIAIDDSDGFFTDALETCKGYWERIFSAAGPALRRQLFERLLAFARQNPCDNDEADIYWYEREHIESFLVDAFVADPAFAPDIQALADERIQEARARIAADRYPGGYRYELGTWTLVRLRAMEALARPLEELEAFAEPLLNERDVRQFFVDRAITHGDTERAIALLEEAAAAAEDRYPTKAAVQLLALYEQTGRVDEATGMLFELATRNASLESEHGLAWFRQLKARTDADEWPCMRDRVLAATRSESTRRRYLAQEGLSDLLKQSIEESGGLADVLRYEDALKERHADWILGQYRASAERDLRPSGSRAVYRSVVELMERMQRLPGGRPVVKEMAEDFKQRYPRRRVLMEELAKLG